MVFLFIFHIFVLWLVVIGTFLREDNSSVIIYTFNISP